MAIIIDLWLYMPYCIIKGNVMSGIALYDAKNRLTDIVRQVENGTPVELTRHGKPVVAIVGIEQYRTMERQLRGFSTACNRYRAEWAQELSEEAAESENNYGDPFGGIREGDEGRSVEL